MRRAARLDPLLDVFAPNIEPRPKAARLPAFDLRGVFVGSVSVAHPEVVLGPAHQSRGLAVVELQIRVRGARRRRKRGAVSPRFELGQPGFHVGELCQNQIQLFAIGQVSAEKLTTRSR